MHKHILEIGIIILLNFWVFTAERIRTHLSSRGQCLPKHPFRYCRAPNNLRKLLKSVLKMYLFGPLFVRNLHYPVSFPFTLKRFVGETNYSFFSET